MSDPNPATPLVEMRGIAKSFHGVCAVRDIDLALFPGEVTALLGDNGAGKTTLVKILSGVIPPDAGGLFVRGRPVDTRRYRVETARGLGIETVHQERSLGEKQPLWRNVFMGRHLTNRLGFIRVAREKAETLEVLHGRLGLRGVGVNADAEVGVLSGGERQGLAIGRAMHFKADIVILDEPTTALSLTEVGKVLDFIAALRAAGKACLFISHNLVHAYLAADRFFLMDRGRCVGRYAKAEISQDGLLRAMMDAARGGRPA